jgi:hypothetical protein
LSAQTVIVLWIAFFFCFSALVQGNQRAYADFTTKTGDTTVDLKDGGTIKDAVLLRHLDRGLLLRRVTDNEVFFVRWEEVRRLAAELIPVEQRDRVCVWFNLSPCPFLPRR